MKANYVEYEIYLCTNCKLFYDGFIMMKRQASLRSAADRRNPQNTVAVISRLQTENDFQSSQETFSQPISVFVFQSFPNCKIQ